MKPARPQQNPTPLPGPDAAWTDLTAADDLANLREPAYGVRFGLWRIAYAGLTLHCHDLLSFYYSARDIFRLGLYDFHAAGPEARILDGGAHIGLFSLYAARRAPGARVIAFEPNPLSLALLRLNLAANKMADRVWVVESGLAPHEGEAEFAAGQSDDSSLCYGARTTRVTTVRLGSFLDSPAAILKLNIEGAECAVMEEAESRLPAVGKVFIEYHGFPELPQTLHRILAVLDRAGFRYCVGAMDQETNPACHPPFRLGQERFFNLVYAERRQSGTADHIHSGRDA